MTNRLDIFRQQYLGANTWAQRKDGVPLNLLDNLSADELAIAESELIESANLGDSWQIIGLGHIKSAKALPVLYKLLAQSKGSMKVMIAHSVFQINSDFEMINIVLDEMTEITNQYQLIDVLYMLRDFKDARTSIVLDKLRFHKEYLVAYNATRAMGLSTEDLVAKFAERKKPANFWKKLFG